MASLLKSNKFGAQKVLADGYVFDSKLEFNVYATLRVHLPKEAIQVHHAIEFAPATERYPAWKWKADFYIPHLDWIVEAKGVFTPEWKEKIRAIDALKPEILDRLTVVAAESGLKICKNLHTIDRAQLMTHLHDYIRSI